MINNHTRWQLASHLISAKKNVDSLLYISSNRNKMSTELYADRVRKIKKEFCISSCIVIDSLSKHSKEEFKEKYPTIKTLYYERNKNSAHRDNNYTPKLSNNLDDLLTYMKFTLLCIRYKCQETLPRILHLDFMPHDRELFRILENVNPEKEKLIHEKKSLFFNPSRTGYSSEKQVQLDDSPNLVENVADLDYVSQNNIDITVLFRDGINLYEGMQNRQDSLITMNVSLDTNSWVNFNSKQLHKFEQLTDLKIIDNFGLLQPLDKLNEKQIHSFFQLFSF